MTTIKRDQLATFRIDPKSWTNFQSWAKEQELSASLALCKLVDLCLNGKIQDLRQSPIAIEYSDSASDNERQIKTLQERLTIVEENLSFLRSNYFNLETLLKELTDKSNEIPVQPSLEEVTTRASDVASDNAITEKSLLITKTLTVKDDTASYSAITMTSDSNDETNQESSSTSIVDITNDSDSYIYDSIKQDSYPTESDEIIEVSLESPSEVNGDSLGNEDQIEPTLIHTDEQIDEEELLAESFDNLTHSEDSTDGTVNALEALKPDQIEETSYLDNSTTDTQKKEEQSTEVVENKEDEPEVIVPIKLSTGSKEENHTQTEIKELLSTMSQKEMAKYLGVNYTTLNRWVLKAKEAEGKEVLEEKLKAYPRYKEEGWRWVPGEGKSSGFFERNLVKV